MLSSGARLFSSTAQSVLFLGIVALMKLLRPSGLNIEGLSNSELLAELVRVEGWFAIPMDIQMAVIAALHLPGSEVLVVGCAVHGREVS